MSPNAARRPEQKTRPAFSAPYAAPDEELAAALLAEAPREAAAEARIDARATRLVEAIRAEIRRAWRHRGFPARVFALDPRGPCPDGAGRGAAARAGFGDRRPADRGQALLRRLDPSRGQIERAAGLGLGLGARHFGAHHPAGRDAGEHPRKPRQAAWPAGGAHRDAAGDAAARLAFRARPEHRGGARRAPRTHREFRYSYDMLGEGARTDADAERYFQSYARAIDAIGATAGNARLPDRPGISVKLSALHPRYEAISRERVLSELTPRVLELARHAKAHDLNFTVDAEEADRLELSLDVIGAVLARSLAGRLGRVRPRDPGLSEARRRGDRLGARCRDCARPPADGAAGQGRLLGHRGEARAGARACRLSGVHPQGDDRSLLHGLRDASCSPRGRSSIRSSPRTMR